MRATRIKYKEGKYSKNSLKYAKCHKDAKNQENAKSKNDAKSKKQIYENKTRGQCRTQKN